MKILFILLVFVCSGFTAFEELAKQSPVPKRLIKSFDDSDVSSAGFDNSLLGQQIHLKKNGFKALEEEIQGLKNFRDVSVFCGRYLNTKKKLNSELLPQFWDNRCSENLKEARRALYSRIKEIFDDSLEQVLFPNPLERICLRLPLECISQRKSLQNTEIPITHGGGLRSILRFLSGNHHGYRLEEPTTGGGPQGFGLQVHPIYPNYDEQATRIAKERPYYYAFYAMEFYGDFPAVLTGTIDPFYLDSASNKYEAGLRSSFFRKLHNINIEIVGCNIIYKGAPHVSNGLKFVTRCPWPDKALILQILSLPADLIHQVLRINRQCQELDLAASSQTKIIEKMDLSKVPPYTNK